MTVTREYRGDPPRRYKVQWRTDYGNWVDETGPGYRTHFGARMGAVSWAERGNDARIIDTRPEKKRSPRTTTRMRSWIMSTIMVAIVFVLAGLGGYFVGVRGIGAGWEGARAVIVITFGTLFGIAILGWLFWLGVTWVSRGRKDN